MGLGTLATTSLNAARRLVDEARILIASATDPLEKRRNDAIASQLGNGIKRTFSSCANDYIEAHCPGWKSTKHLQQWRNTLRDYAIPSIGKMSVEEITTEHVVRLLRKNGLWSLKNETANRVRVRIENILDWAKALGYRKGENPARWRGHLENLLPSPSKIQKLNHHAALPVDDLPYFMADLATQASTGAAALRLALLTATRTSEIIQARWCEVDFSTKTWTIPASRTKSGVAHMVPLSTQAIRILQTQRIEDAPTNTFIFTGREGKSLSTSAMGAVLDQLGYTIPVQQGQQNVRPNPSITYPDGRPKPHITVHGTCRSTFRDWVAEKTEFPRDLAEMALAHTIGDKTEAAYRRGKMLERRRVLMQAWANFLNKKPKAPASAINPNNRNK